MQTFVHPDPARFGGQLLQLSYQGNWYRFRILHASDQLFETGGKPAPDGRRRGHRHDVYHVLLYTAGENRFVLGDADPPCRRGTLACSDPDQLHEFPPQIPGMVSYRQVTFELVDPQGRQLREPLHRVLGWYAGMTLRPCAFPLQLDARLTSRIEFLLRRVFELLQQDDSQPLVVAQTLIELFHILASEVFAVATPAAQLAADRLDDVARRLRAGVDRRPVMDDLARRCQLSTGAFHRAFKRRFGCSPLAYQTRLRIEAAQRLLTDTDTALREIAERLGFVDEFHFNRMFCRLVGTPPGRYRRARNDAGQGPHGI